MNDILVFLSILLGVLVLLRITILIVDLIEGDLNKKCEQMDNRINATESTQQGCVIFTSSEEEE